MGQAGTSKALGRERGDDRTSADVFISPRKPRGDDRTGRRCRRPQQKPLPLRVRAAEKTWQRHRKSVENKIHKRGNKGPRVNRVKIGQQLGAGQYTTMKGTFREIYTLLYASMIFEYVMINDTRTKRTIKFAHTRELKNQWNSRFHSPSRAKGHARKNGTTASRPTLQYIVTCMQTPSLLGLGIENKQRLGLAQDPVPEGARTGTAIRLIR